MAEEIKKRVEFEVKKVEYGLLEFNFEEMKADLENQLVKYQNVHVTESNIGECKEIKANLNKVKDVIDIRRKALKKEFLKPLDDFEEKVKVLTGLVDDCTNKITVQLKQYDEKYKVEKLKDIKEWFDEKNFYVELSQLWEDSYYNKTNTINKVKDSIDNKIKRIEDELLVLNNCTNVEEERNRLKSRYLRTLDLSLTLNEYNKEKEMANKLAKQQAEQQKAQETTENKDTTIYTLTFEVNATYDKLMELSKYLKQNNYDYRRINNEQ